MITEATIKENISGGLNWTDWKKPKWNSLLRSIASCLALAGLGFLPFSSLSAADSVGLNLSVEGNAETDLQPADAAGYAEVEQSNWNNLPGVTGTAKKLKDRTGADVIGMTAAWEVPPGDTAWRSLAGAPWGFTENNLKLQLGILQLEASLTVRGIPYRKYAVYVYLNAGENGGTGQVTIKSPTSGVDPNGTYFYTLGWLNGVFTKSTATTLETATDANFVVFEGNTAKAFTLNWKGNLKGGWSGASAVQIVETP